MNSQWNFESVLISQVETTSEILVNIFKLEGSEFLLAKITTYTVLRQISDFLL